jgi:putative PEP-CTERM system TPR-repeat lipoprotein
MLQPIRLLRRCWPILALASAVVMPLHASSDTDEYLKDARAYLKKQQPKAAVIQLKNALRQDPGHIEVRLLLGSTYLGLADGPAAEKEYDRAAQIGAPAERWMPGYAQALALQNNFAKLLAEVKPDAGMATEVQAGLSAMRGDAHLALNQTDEAVGEYDQSLKKDPMNPQAKLGKARILIVRKQPDAAKSELDQLVASHPGFADAYLVRGELHRRAGDLAAAAQDFAAAVELAPNNVRAYVGAGLVAVAQGRSDDALQAVDQIRQRFGDMPFASYLHGLAAFQKRDFETSGEQLQAVLAAMPSHLQSQLLFGVVNYAKGDYRIADEYLSRVASNVGQNLAIAKLLGATRLKLREAERAVDALQAVADRYPEDAQLLALLGNAYLQTGDNSRGSEYLARAVELDPDQALLRTQLALGQLAGGDTDGAIGELEAAVELGQELVQADVLLVLSYLNKKDHAKAIAAAEKLEKRMPNSPIPFNLTGLAFLAKADFQQAEEKFLHALELDPDFVVADMNRARLALLTGKPDEAKRHYEAVLSKRPDHVGAMLGLASAAEKRGDKVALEAWLKQANKANPAALQPALLLAELYLRQGHALKALNLLNSIPEAQREVPAALRAKGIAQLQMGEPNNAVRTLEKLTAQRPDYIEGWFQLARAQSATGAIDKSRSSFRRAIELDTNNRLPLLWVGLSELELRARRYAVALELAEEMQARFADNATSYEIEAAAQRGLGQMGLALAAVEKAVRAEGNTKRVNLFAHSLAASGQAEKAIKVLEDWLAEHAKDATSWTTLGMLQQRAARRDQAIAAYETALAISDENPVIFNNLAWLYHSVGDRRALKTAKQAYEIAPERPEIVDTYGWILFQSGNTEEGLAMLQQALVQAPRNPEIALHVAEALTVAGRADEAGSLLRRVIRDHTGSDWASKAKQMLAAL